MFIGGGVPWKKRNARYNVMAIIISKVMGCPSDGCTALKLTSVVFPWSYDRYCKVYPDERETSTFSSGSTSADLSLLDADASIIDSPAKDQRRGSSLLARTLSPIGNLADEIGASRE